MKTQSTSKLIAAALAGMVGLASSAQALTLIYETGPKTGLPFDGDQIAFKFTGFGIGNVYPKPAVAPFSVGFGAGGAAASIAGGITAVDGIVPIIPVTSPTAVRTFINGVDQGAGTTSPEDAWSIARVTTIIDKDGETIWSQAVKGTQITALQSGGKDFYTSFNPATQFQTTDIVGVRLELYEVSTAGFPSAATFNGTFGPGPSLANPLGGHGGNSLLDGQVYPGVTNGAPIFIMRSAAGFVHPDGVLGGLATEIESVINLSGSGGNGSLSLGFFDIIGGSLQSQYNTNRIASGVAGGRALNADVQIEFTQTSFNTLTGLNPAGWVVATNDPATFFIPEPGTALFGLGCLVPALLGRRRRKSA